MAAFTRKDEHIDQELTQALPRVLIVSRRTVRKEKFVDFVGEYHLDLVVRLSRAVPIIVPRTAGIVAMLDAFEPFHGLVLCEGEDIDVSYLRRAPEPEEDYALDSETLARVRSSHPSDTAIDPEKDSIEFELVRRCLQRGIPLLGICRGCQVINVSCGGSLYVDVEEQLRKGVRHINYGDYDGHRHPIAVVPDTPLRTWFAEEEREEKEDDGNEDRKEDGKGKENEEERGDKGALSLAVNSYHHQGCKRLGAGLRPMAFAPDRLVEAFYREGFDPEHGVFCVGLQFHPERMVRSDGTYDYPGCPRVYEAFGTAVQAYFRKTTNVDGGGGSGGVASSAMAGGPAAAALAVEAGGPPGAESGTMATAPPPPLPRQVPPRALPPPLHLPPRHSSAPAIATAVTTATAELATVAAPPSDGVASRGNGASQASASSTELAGTAARRRGAAGSAAAAVAVAAVSARLEERRKVLEDGFSAAADEWKRRRGMERASLKRTMSSDSVQSAADFMLNSCHSPAASAAAAAAAYREHTLLQRAFSDAQRRPSLDGTAAAMPRNVSWPLQGAAAVATEAANTDNGSTSAFIVSAAMSAARAVPAPASEAVARVCQALQRAKEELPPVLSSNAAAQLERQLQHLQDLVRVARGAAAAAADDVNNGNSSCGGGNSSIS